eukprot:CAMPEP_0172326004 /NCGR_PEP_ID=MMETSP1058-20130122/55305_1 /TAXON_ID=83371 /ORGANISM="Detonula confervacea, Strain CCMP 353" /LENGTH=95 /DNA_ID=CAMNT_0013042679 /DNA_START=41 /DNA_END=324 /DNA_ORIENTATION=-
MTTGSAHGIGKGGDINLKVGTGSMADGGDISLMAGKVGGNTFIGGTLTLTSGASDYISGDVNMKTPGTREKSYGSGNSGNINIKTGSSYRGNSGA